MTYSYDVTELNNESVSRMRFELGDTLFNPAELTAALSDEEYAAVISESSSWKKAKPHGAEGRDDLKDQLHKGYTYEIRTPDYHNSRSRIV